MAIINAKKGLATESADKDKEIRGLLGALCVLGGKKLFCSLRASVTPW